MKLTKKSYNRRMFALGALLFLSIGLVSTGFAAFVMSKGATKDIGGNIQVGTVTDGSVKIDNLKFEGDKNTILFEAKENDEQGEVKWDKNNPTQFENLKVTLTGEVSPVTYVEKLTINMSSEHEGIQAAADAGYIELPECWGVDTVIVENPTNGDDNPVYTFSYTIEFKWGSKFGGQNPSVFLDLPTAKDGTSAYSYEEKKAIMKDFKKTIYAMDDTATEEDIFEMSDPLPFKAVLSVTSRV